MYWAHELFGVPVRAAKNGKLASGSYDCTVWDFWRRYRAGHISRVNALVLFDVKLASAGDKSREGLGVYDRSQKTTKRLVISGIQRQFALCLF